MYDNLHIEVMDRGGYVVQVVRREMGAYSPFIAAFSTKSELLSWLDVNLISRVPDSANKEAAENILTPNKDTDDEIPF